MKRLNSVLSVIHIVMLVAILIVLAACGGGTPAPGASADATSSASAGESAEAQLELTADELAQYDGKDGQPAYIAVDGVIYDVTDVPQWRNGDHNGFTAGKDLTEEIKTISPHGVSKLKGLPVVGKLIDG
jgi:predicted heme/steroid binding protein